MNDPVIPPLDLPPLPKQEKRQLDLNMGSAKTEMRRDYIHEYYVLVAPKRRDRPFDIADNRSKPLVETADSPRLDLQTTVYQRTDHEGRWTTKVVENKFPALSLDNPLAFGVQELVIDTPLRNVAFGQLEPDQIAEVLFTYQARARSLGDNQHIKYVAIFRNDGSAAGASLSHAHSQIAALPIAPPRLMQESNTIDAYLEKHQKDPFEMILAYEKKEQSRIIHSTPLWQSFAPYASAWQMEAWILPTRAISTLAEASSDELQELAQHLKIITSQLSEMGISYNLSVEQGLTTNQRLSFKIRGRDVLSPRGGLEIGTDIIINAIPPEAAADWYRRGI